MDINSKMLMAEIQSVIDVVRAKQLSFKKTYEKAQAILIKELSVPTVAIYTADGVKTFYKIETKVESDSEDRHLTITSVKPIDPNGDRTKLPQKVQNALATYDAGEFDNRYAQVLMSGSGIDIVHNGSKQDDLALLTERLVIAGGETTGSYLPFGYTWSVPLFQSSLRVPGIYLNIFENWIRPITEGCDDRRWNYSFSKYLSEGADGLRVRARCKDKTFNIVCIPLPDTANVKLGFMFTSPEHIRLSWTLILPDLDAIPDEDDEHMFTDTITVLKSSTIEISDSIYFPYKRSMCERTSFKVIPHILCGSCRDTELYSIGSGIFFSGVMVFVHVTRMVTDAGKIEYEISAKTKLTKYDEGLAEQAKTDPQSVEEIGRYTLRKYRYHASHELSAQYVVAQSWYLYEGLYNEIASKALLDGVLNKSRLTLVDSKITEDVPVYSYVLEEPQVDD
jgi:hypothetical protein